MASYLDSAGLAKYHDLIIKYIDDADDALVWVGTRAEYEAQKADISPEAFIIITDESPEEIGRIANEDITNLFG